MIGLSLHACAEDSSIIFKYDKRGLILMELRIPIISSPREERDNFSSPLFFSHLPVAIVSKQLPVLH